MKEIQYMISDAAKKVDVESHVLRYWEEELGLTVSRNDMGHRYYTEDDIRLFQNIKTLKDQGFQLKAVKLLLPELHDKAPAALSNLVLLREELNQRVLDMDKSTALQPTFSSEGTVAPQQKLDLLKQLITDCVQTALEENNRHLAQELSKTVSRDLSEDMEGFFRDREQRDAERFRNLDTLIRKRQNGLKEVAATQAAPPKKFFLFKKK